jgi:hypothetical protein
MVSKINILDHMVCMNYFSIYNQRNIENMLRQIELSSMIHNLIDILNKLHSLESCHPCTVGRPLYLSLNKYDIYLDYNENSYLRKKLTMKKDFYMKSIKINWLQNMFSMASYTKHKNLRQG